MASMPNLDQPAPPSTVVFSNDLSDTLGIGHDLAQILEPGDLVCVNGPLGAGKSELCRAIIRARVGDPHLEVPSPSYTLVNVYEHEDIQIWHADLYRVGDESELDEIGLEDAVGSALVLVEWPDRWPGLPPRRLEITIQPTGADQRRLTFDPVGADWDALGGYLKGSA